MKARKVLDQTHEESDYEESDSEEDSGSEDAPDSEEFKSRKQKADDTNLGNDKKKKIEGKKGTLPVGRKLICVNQHIRKKEKRKTFVGLSTNFRKHSLSYVHAMRSNKRK